MSITPARSAAAITPEPITTILSHFPAVYWRMNDASGNVVNIGNLGSKNGVANGTPTYQSAKLPPRSEFACVEFNGTTDYFRVTNAAITGTDPTFSFGCWISTTAGAGGAMTVFQQQDTDSNYCGFRLYTNGFNSLVFESHHTDATSQMMTVNSVTPLSTGEPIYVGVTADATHFRMYINGEYLGVLERTTVTYVSGSDIYIGRAEGAYRYWDGLISDLFIAPYVLSADDHYEIWRKGNLNMPRPRGDNFHDLVVLEEGVTETLTTVNATETTDDPDDGYLGFAMLHKTIWLKYAPEDQVLLELDGSGHSVAIWIDSDDLEEMNETWNGYDYFKFTTGLAVLDPLPEGQAYYLCVGHQGYSSTYSPGPFDISATTIVPPANDDFADAITISVVSADDTTGVTIGATVEDEQEGVMTGCPHQTVWYKFTADATGNITFDTESVVPYLYYALAIWDATADSIVTINDMDFTDPLGYDTSSGVDGSALLTVAVVSGNVYYVQVSNQNAAPDGDFTLTWTDIT